jgi:multidrug transporter EmrE-like cation transporter
MRLEWLSLVFAALLWGMSNPVMKKTSAALVDINKDTSSRSSLKKLKPEKSKLFETVHQLLREFLFLFSRPLYTIAFAVNMLGSVIFYLSLRSLDISLVVPLVNSLTFLFTTIFSRLLGEKNTTAYTYLGMLCVLVGVTICVSSNQ